VSHISAAVCTGSWSPIASAGPQSALSGILAGFVFTGMVVVLSTKPDAGVQPGASADYKSKQRSFALQLLAAAFISLALDSYITSITSGELICARANAESAWSSGTLGIGAVMLLAGLAWLLVTYSERTEDLGTILQWMMGAVGVLIIVMLAISAMGFGDTLLQKRSQAFEDAAPWVIAAALTATVLILVRRHWKGGDTSQLAASDDPVSPTVRRSALLALADAVLSAILTGVTSATPTDWWTHPSSLLVGGIVVFAMVLPGVALVASVPPTIAALTGRHMPASKKSKTTAPLAADDGTDASLAGGVG
jgi:hypothetical protein